jgi:WD40 repeat protein
MPKLIRLFDLSLPVEVRHIVFADENTLAFTTPTADVWKVNVGPTPQEPQLWFSAQQVLHPLLQKNPALAQPAGGGYPQLAVSLPASCLVLNPNDVVLIACPLSGGQAPRLIANYWGLHYPRLQFSPDHSWFSAMSDGQLLACKTRDWTGQLLEGIAVSMCSWHPREPSQLCVEYDGTVFWAHRARGEIEQLGKLRHIHRMAVLPDGERFVAALHPPCIEVWRVNPLQMIEYKDTEDGRISDIVLSPNGKWLVIFSEEGVRLWNTETPLELSDLYPSTSRIDFATSGDRFVTHRFDATGANPYPLDEVDTPDPDEDLVTCWEISE